MVAARLGLPQLTFANKVVVEGGTVTIHRQTDYGYDEVTAAMPAVVSVVEKTNEPRYPSFKGIMAAKKAPLETLTLADLGIDGGEVGLGSAWSTVRDFAARPPKAAGTVVTDDGDGAAQLEAFLVGQKLV
jgi:electron transfer flavoprotein beta subunit